VFQYCWSEGSPALVDLGLDAANKSLLSAPIIRRGRGCSHVVSAEKEVWERLLEDLDFSGDFMRGGDDPGFAPIARQCRKTAERIREEIR